MECAQRAGSCDLGRHRQASTAVAGGELSASRGLAWGRAGHASTRSAKPPVPCACDHRRNRFGCAGTCRPGKSGQSPRAPGRLGQTAESPPSAHGQGPVSLGRDNATFSGCGAALSRRPPPGGEPAKHEREPFLTPFPAPGININATIVGGSKSDRELNDYGVYYPVHPVVPGRAARVAGRSVR